MREASAVEPPDQVADASRRTYLAGERTYLAWWRSGLESLFIGVLAAWLPAYRASRIDPAEVLRES